MAMNSQLEKSTLATIEGPRTLQAIFHNGLGEFTISSR